MASGKLPGIRYLLCVLITSACSWSCSVTENMSHLLGMQPLCLMLWLSVHALIQSFKVRGQRADMLFSKQLLTAVNSAMSA